MSTDGVSDAFLAVWEASRPARLGLVFPLPEGALMILGASVAWQVVIAPATVVEMTKPEGT